jgi:hypothetical protein
VYIALQFDRCLSCKQSNHCQQQASNSSSSDREFTNGAETRTRLCPPDQLRSDISVNPTTTRVLIVRPIPAEVVQDPASSPALLYQRTKANCSAALTKRSHTRYYLCNPAATTSGIRHHKLWSSSLFHPRRNANRIRTISSCRTAIHPSHPCQSGRQ